MQTKIRLKNGQEVTVQFLVDELKKIIDTTDNAKVGVEYLAELAQIYRYVRECEAESLSIHKKQMESKNRSIEEKIVEIHELNGALKELRRMIEDNLNKGY